MNRLRMMWIIIILAGITGIAQYVLLGMMASNQSLELLPGWFWVVEFILWAVRAIVEVSCIAYMFSTVAERWQDKISLAIFEAVILAVITFTVGIMFQAVGQSQSIFATILQGEYKLWTYAIGAYMPLIIGGAGIAYRVQPFVIGTVNIDKAQLDEVEKLRRSNQELQTANIELQAATVVDEAWALLPKAAKARIISRELPSLNGNQAQIEAAAKAAYGATAMSRAKKEV